MITIIAVFSNIFAQIFIHAMRQSRSINAIFLGLFLISTSTTLFSQNWTGAVNTDWNNSGNWSTWPLNGVDILIDPAQYSVTGNHPQINVNSVFIPANILVQNGGQITINANIQTAEDFEIVDLLSHVTISGGTTSVGPGNGGRLICDLGGSLTINSGTVVVDERLISGEDALITINGGNVSTGERLLLDLGGHIIHNSGSVFSAQVFALADGNINGSCYYEMHGGTLTVNGEMALENEAGNFEPTFFMDGGTFVMNGDIFWLGVSPGSGRPKFIAEGGTLTVNGNIENMVASTVNLHLEINENSNATFNGSTITLLLPADSIKQNNNIAFHWNNVATITNPGIIYSKNSVIDITGSTVLTGNGTNRFSSLTLNPGSTFTNQAINGVELQNNLVNNGMMNNTASSVLLSGSMNQDISGTSVTTFYDLNVAQQSNVGIDLLNDIVIQHHFQLNMGVLFSVAGSEVFIVDNATASFGNQNSFVNGPIQKTGNDAFVFPVGKNGKWMRYGISAPIAVGSQVTVEYMDQPYVNTTAVNSPLSTVNNIEYWSVQTGVSPGVVQVELFWENASLSGITACPNLTTAAWNGLSWDNIVSSTSGVCSGTGSGSVNSIYPSGLKEAYTFGQYGNVNLLNFQICQGDSVLVAGNYYEIDSVYLDILTDVNGNDSTLITDLTVIPSTILAQNITLCAGDSLLIGSNYYSVGGIYTDTLTSLLTGCDSIQISTINITGPLDLNVGLSGITLTVYPGLSSYQWLDCDNAFVPITGEISNSFTAIADGNYAVVMSDGFCIDTTNCYQILGVGLTEMNESNSVIYPNPTRGEIQFILQDQGVYQLRIYSTAGKVVFDSQVENGQNINLTDIISGGIYIVELTNDQSTKIIQRLIIE